MENRNKEFIKNLCINVIFFTLVEFFNRFNVKK